MLDALDRIGGADPAMTGRVDAANAVAVERMLAADPVLVDVRPAAEVVEGLDDRMVLHAGPPIEWARMCGPMRGAVAGAIVLEAGRRPWRPRARWPRRGRSGSRRTTTTTRSVP